MTILGNEDDKSSSISKIVHSTAFKLDYLRYFLILLMSFFTIACSVVADISEYLEAESVDPESLAISGSLELAAFDQEEPNTNARSSKQSIKASQQSIQFVTCESPKAYLYKLDSNGRMIEPEIASAEVKNQRYEFKNLLDHSLIDQSGSLSDSLAVEVIGCSEPFVRIITGFEKQDINRGISLISQSIFSTEASRVSEATKSDVEDLFNLAKEFKNQSELYQKLQSDEILKEKFQKIFGIDPVKLSDLPPRFVKQIIPDLVPEGSPSVFKVQAAHWKTDDQLQYEWTVNGVQVSTDEEWIFNPGKNAQGIYQVEVKSVIPSIGSVQDRVIRKSFLVKVENTYLPEAPPISTNGWIWTKNRNIQLQIQTGSLKKNCESFEKLALTFDSIMAPLSRTEYTIDCLDEQTQDISIELPFGDGPKTLALWAVDKSGKVSDAPSILLVNLDQTTPTISMSPAVSYKGGSSVGLSFSISDGQGSGITSGSLKYSLDGGNTYSDLSGFSPSQANYNWSVPIVDVNSAKLRFQVQDVAGNMTILTTPGFAIDSTAPSLSISNPAVSYRTQSAINLSGACESGLPVVISGDGVSEASSSCVSGVYSMTLSLAGADGTKTINVTQQDSVGNITTISRPFIKDTLGPVVAFAGPAANTKARTSLLISGTCENGLDVNISGSGISNSGAASCSSGTFSYNVNLVGIDGLKTILISQTDAAGNTSTQTRQYEKYNQAPILTLSNPTNGSSVKSPFVLTGNCDSDYSVVVSGSGTTSAGSYSCSSGTYSISLNLTSGEEVKQILLSQEDNIGNSTSLNLSYNRDDTPPALSLVNPIAGGRFQNAVTVSGNCEANRDVVVSGSGLLSSQTISCSSGTYSQSVSLSPGEGTKNFDVTQVDQAGNSASLARAILRDNTTPVLAVLSHSENQVVNGSLVLSGSCEDSSSGGAVDVTISGSALASSVITPCVSGVFSQALTLIGADGAKSLTITQLDTAGNSGSMVRQIILDKTPPSLTKTSPVDNSFHQGAVTIVGACESGFQVNVSGTGITASQSQLCVGAGYSIPVTLDGTDGSKSVIITQADAVGNSSSLNLSLIKDTQSPVLAFTSPNALTSVKSGLTIAGNCETGLSVNLSGSGLHSPSSTTCSSGSFSVAVTFTAGDGNKVISIAQVDGAGNTSAVSRTFVRDNVAPILTLASPAAGTSAQASVILTGACENGVTISYSGAGILSNFNGSCSGGTYSQQVFFKNDVDGTKTLTVSQTDEAGNISSVSRDFIRDNVAPILSQTARSYPYYSNTSSITFGGACESNVSVVIKKSGINQGTAACNSGVWSYTVANESSDSAYDYSFHQTDSAGNTSDTVGRWIRDTVSPSLVITSGANQLTASNSVTISGACESGASSIVVSGSATGSVPCNSGSWTYTTPAVSTDAVRTYNFALTDQAGNTGTASTQWERNTNVPNLTITTANPIKNKDNNASITGICEVGFNIEVKLAGSIESTIPCSSGTYSYNTTTQTSDGVRSYELKQTNSVNLSTTASINWIRDTAAPVFTDNQFKLNANDSTTTKARVSVAVQATDNLTNVSHLCLKVNDSAVPVNSASCWVAVDSTAIGLTPALSFSVSNYGFNLPITPATYSIYAWVRDEVGNISTLTNAGSGTSLKDLETIQLVSTIPPTLSYVLVGSTDYPAQPPSNTDLTVGTGAPVYLKWKASDDQVLPSNGISIYFTTDEVNWSLVANNLSNGANGSCTVNHSSTPADDDATGCYRMSASPASGFVKFRVIVRDVDGLETGVSSVALNLTSIMKFLAGNTDPGLNLSAQSAMFFYRRMSSDATSTDMNTLVVTRDGVVYFKDMNRGILKVDPADGIVRTFLRSTGTTSGDGGPVSSATARRINKIALDHNQPKQRLWIFDFDRIRRVDLSTGIITTVIGGGTDESDTVANPLSVKVTDYYQDYEWWDGWMPFFATPNGDFYFRAGNDGYWDSDSRPAVNKLRLRKYSSSTGQISSWRVSSVTSARDLATADYNYCQLRPMGFGYDPTTSNLTDRIGLIRGAGVFSGCPGGSSNFGSLVGFNASGVSDSSLHPLNPRSNTAWWNERLRFYTGLDGRLYSVSKDHLLNGIFRYEGHPTYGWTRILGGGASDFAQGFCADGTDATACRSRAADIFVSENSTVYFLDDGLIRTINTAGKVVTLMGQRQISGHGGPVSSIRLGSSIRSFRLRNDGGILFGSQAHQQIHEIDPNGTFYHIAGNGVLGGAADGVDAKTTNLNIENPNSSGDDFALDPSTGDLYHHAGTWAIRKLTRSSASIGATGTWSQWLGGGTNHWANPSADGSSSIRWDGDCSYGADTNIFSATGCWFFPKVIAFGNGKLLTHQSTWVRRISDNAELGINHMMKLYDVSTKVQSHLIGKNGYNSVTNNAWDGIGSVGTALNALDFWAADWSRVATPIAMGGGRWLFAKYWDGGQKHIYDVTPGGNLISMTQTSMAIKSFAYRHHSGTDYIYYCSASNHLLYRRNVQLGTEVNLPFPITGMSCQSSAMYYRSGSQGLLLAYSLNGLTGFAEYYDPM